MFEGKKWTDSETFYRETKELFNQAIEKNDKKLLKEVEERASILDYGNLIDGAHELYTDIIMAMYPKVRFKKRVVIIEGIVLAIVIALAIAASYMFK